MTHRVRLFTRRLRSYQYPGIEKSTLAHAHFGFISCELDSLLAFGARDYRDWWLEMNSSSDRRREGDNVVETIFPVSHVSSECDGTCDLRR